MNTHQTDETTREELAADGTRAGVEHEDYIPYPFDAEKISITDRRVPFETLTRRLRQNTITRDMLLSRNLH